MSRLISLNDVTDCQLCTSVAPPFLWQPASGRTPAAVVFSVMADVIPVQVIVNHVHASVLNSRGNVVYAVLLAMVNDRLDSSLNAVCPLNDTYFNSVVISIIMIMGVQSILQHSVPM
jgi:hypothetical protein